MDEANEDYEERQAAVYEDAERYRWLRDEYGDVKSPYVCGVHGAPMGDAGWLCSETLDTAIDTAMRAEKGEK